MKNYVFIIFWKSTVNCILLKKIHLLELCLFTHEVKIPMNLKSFYTQKHLLNLEVLEFFCVLLNFVVLGLGVLKFYYVVMNNFVQHFF